MNILRQTKCHYNPYKVSRFCNVFSIYLLHTPWTYMLYTYFYLICMVQFHKVGILLYLGPMTPYTPPF